MEGVQKTTKKASAITKAKNISSKSKNSLLDKFNALGAFMWLNLDSMIKNKFYHITDIKRATSKYGERLLAELDGQAKLYLPER